MTTAEHPAHLRAAARTLKQWFGIEVPPYRLSVLANELEHLGGRAGPEAGLERLLAREQSAWDAVLEVMTIPETYLFRHFGHFELLAELAAKRRASGDPCRVLCAGCSTGEEVWSAAAVLAEACAPRSEVVGWDLSERRLAIALAGRYRDWSVRAGLHGYDSHFRRSGDAWEIGSSLRSLVSFKRVNLVGSIPPRDARFDVVLFRNVGIYWADTIATAAVSALADLVAPEDGLFLIGPSDPGLRAPDTWEHVIERGVRYYRRARAARAEPAPAVAPARSRPSSHERRARRSARSSSPAARPAASSPVSSARPRTMASPRRHAPAAASRSPDPTAAERDPLDDVRALADAGRSRDALAMLDALRDTSVRARLWRGILLLDLEQPREAVIALRQCVLLEPAEVALRRWLAVAYEAAGRSEDAERENRNAQELGGA